MPRKAKLIEIPAIAPLDRQAGSLSRQLSQALRAAVRQGKLQAGDALPSTRALAAALRLSRGTVSVAYDQLIAEGVLTAQPGSGTRVAAIAAGTPPSPSRSGGPHGEPTLSERAQAFARFAGGLKPLLPAPFTVSLPVGDTAPGDIWRRLGNRVRARGPGAPDGYGDPQGALPLRRAICEYVRQSRSVICTPEQIVVTCGTQQGLYLAAQILLDAGDRAWVEDPAYPGVTALFTTALRDRQMVRVPVGDEGIDVDAGRMMAPDARAAFVTPSHQYPLGMPMSMAQRTALLGWAQAHNAWIVEDDYDSEMRYDGHPFPALQGQDPARVIYLGTFSKVLFPSLRLGYAIVPPALVGAFCGARILMDRHPPNADQYVLAQFMAEGHLARHLRRMRSLYADKRRVVIDAVSRHIAAGLAELQPCDQGMHMVLWLRRGLDDRHIERLAQEAGVSVRALSPMYAAGHGRSGLILGLGGYGDRQVEQAVITLNQLLQTAQNLRR